METLIECPVCGNNDFSSYLMCKDYLVSGEEFSIEECKQCKFRFTNPRPDQEQIGSYYKSEQYVSHNDNGTGVVNAAYRLVRKYTLRSKLELINKLNKGAGNILDVGCGTGAFLEACQQGDWKIVGMEPDNDARSVATQKLKAPVYPNLSTIDVKNQFNIISLWHVLEHVATLDDSIQNLRRLLDEKGTLVIAVPNSNSYDAQYFKQYWAAYDLPRHLHHFTPETIKSLFKKNGFSLTAQKPMVFDAYYIAMLSTRYQTGETDYLKSLMIGLKSNNKARKTGDYSSLIYLFQKD